MDELVVVLGKKLKSIYDNKEFIIEVLSNADNPEDQQTIIDFIDAGEDVDDETISVLAMDLADARAVSKNRVVNADGSYSEIFYMDDEGNACDKNEATKCIIRECDANGGLLQEVFGTVNS